jgi:hypothetical protein
MGRKAKSTVAYWINVNRLLARSPTLHQRNSVTKTNRAVIPAQTEVMEVNEAEFGYFKALKWKPY